MGQRQGGALPESIAGHRFCEHANGALSAIFVSFVSTLSPRFVLKRQRSRVLPASSE
jgi:hypothetical protein